MKKSVKIIALIAALVLSILALVGTAYAWFVQRRDSMVLVSGDIKINVTHARYAFVTEEDGAEVFVENGDGILGFSDLNEKNLNTVPMTFGDNYVIYEFDIENESVTDANISLRLSEFSSYLSKGITSFQNAGEEEQVNIPYENYTGKNILFIKYVKYKYENVKDTDNYDWENGTLDATKGNEIWKYSYGDYIIGNSGLYKAIKLDAKKTENQEKPYKVTVRIAIDNGVNQETLDSYYSWLLAKNGYVFNMCERELPSKGMGTDETLITNYLEKVKKGEQDALGKASEKGAAAGEGGFSLTINYFEFSGENIPGNDSGTP